MQWRFWRRFRTEQPGILTSGLPSSLEGAQQLSPETALSISTVWACVELRAQTIASLPFFAYYSKDGARTLARDHGLYRLLHDAPNARQTAMEFWRTMVMHRDLRGNAYARIDRHPTGSALALTPLDPDAVEVKLLEDGTLVYLAAIGRDVLALAAENVLHLRGIGSGSLGLDRLAFMAPTLSEARAAQQQSLRLFSKGGRTGGLLYYDKTLTPEQRKQIESSLQMIAAGASIAVLEAGVKFEQMGLSPVDQQLLTTRRFAVEDVCRFFGVPPVLVHHSNVTTWGSGVEQILDGFHKLTLRPLLVEIEQAVRRSVMTTGERLTMTAEFSHDALLRGNIKDRAQVYASAAQNGWMTRAEIRQLENLPPMDGADQLTAQSNLAPVASLGKKANGNQDLVAQAG